MSSENSPSNIPQTNSENPKGGLPLSDSPWFWVMAFCLFGLAVILLAGKKYNKRQAAIEIRFQVKNRTDRINAGDTSEQVLNPKYSSPEDKIIDLWPLYVLFGGMGVFSAWRLVLWRKRQLLVEG